MLEQGRPQNTRTNMVLWISVAVLSVLGLGANVYKANTGEEFEWASTIAETCVLLAAGCFIFAYYRGGRKDKEK